MPAFFALWLVTWKNGLVELAAVVSAGSAVRALAVAGVAAAQRGWPLGPDAWARVIGDTRGNEPEDGDRVFTLGSSSHAWLILLQLPIAFEPQVLATQRPPPQHTRAVEEELARRWGIAVAGIGERPLGRVIQLLGSIGIDLAQPLNDDWRDNIVARLEAVGARVRPSEVSRAWVVCEAAREKIQRRRGHVDTAPAAPAPEEATDA